MRSSAACTLLSELVVLEGQLVFLLQGDLDSGHLFGQFSPQLLDQLVFLLDFQCELGDLEVLLL